MKEVVSFVSAVFLLNLISSSGTRVVAVSRGCTLFPEARSS